MKSLKSDLHIHTSEDPEDLVRYSAIELIDRAHSLGYQVLSITNHNHLTYSNYLRDYALERGIVLIPGMEATIQGKHVLLYNIDFANVDRSSIAGLKALKRPDSLVIAPHPYFPSPVALGNRLDRHADLFDAIEHCHLYTKRIDFNARARKLAIKRDIPIVGTSDAHQRSQFHTTYSLIRAEAHPVAVIQAIKNGYVEVVSRPLDFNHAVCINLKMIWRNAVLKRLP